MAIRNWVGTLKTLALGRHLLLRSTTTLADPSERVLTHAGSAKVKFLGVFVGLVDDSKRKRQYEKALEKRRRVIHRLRQLQKQRTESWEKEVERLALNAFTRGYRKTLNTLRSGSKAKQAIFDKATELGTKAALTLTDEQPLTTSEDLKRLLAQEEDHFARLGWEYLPVSVKTAYENLMLSIEVACEELKSEPPKPRRAPRATTAEVDHPEPEHLEPDLPDLNVCYENVLREVSDADALQATYERIKPKLQLLAGKSDDDWRDLSSFDHTAQRLRSGSYRFSPVSQIHVRRPGKDNAARMITVVSPMDQVVAEVVKAALERIYTPVFTAHRYKSCASSHTALKMIKNSWKGTTWFAHYKCPVGRAQHEHLLRILASRVKDDAFLHLLEEMLQAGVSERLSAVLCNVYFLQLDMEVTRMQKELNAGSRNRKEAHLQQGVEYARVRYVRYGDEFLFGITGSKVMAMDVVDRVHKFLRCELKMQGS